MGKRIFLVILVFLLLVGFGAYSWAESQDDMNLGEVVVEATKSGETVKDTPATVYVITDEDVKQTADTRNIGDILWQVPGVFGEDKHHTDANVITFRGIAIHDWVTYGILVLVDGIPVNDADGRVDFQSIDLDNVKRIEVIKGPVSALYGPNGSVGVINIVTKTPPKRFAGKASFSYGSYKTWKALVSGGQTVGTVGVRLSAMRRGSQGYLPRSSYFEDKVSGKITKDLGDLGDINMDLFYGHTSRETPGPLNEEEFENQERVASMDNSSTEMTFYKAAISYKKGFSESSIHWNLYYHRKNWNSQWSSGSSRSYLHTLGTEARYLQIYDLFRLPSRFTVGASVTTEKGLTEGQYWTGPADYYSIQNNYGIYAQNIVSLAKPLKVTLGLRYDRLYYKNSDRISGDKSGTKSIGVWSPKFGVTYNYKAQTVYLSIGRGFIPPTMRQIYWAPIPNPDLKPEYLTDYEMGIRGKISKDLNYEMDVYYIRIKDEIEREDHSYYDPVAHEYVSLYKYVNLSKTKHKGFEANLSWRFLNHFVLRANYSFNISRFVNDPTYGDNYLKKAPKHMMGLGLTYLNNGLTMSVWMRKIWKYYMDNENTEYYSGYTLVNAKVSYHWRRFFASFYVNNLLDNNYATWAYRSSYRGDMYFPGWPLNVMFTVGVKF